MRASDLHCIGPAQKAALQLERQFPLIDFTSGRRDVVDQARAMASNVVRNRNWIEQTYLGTPESRALQAWVDGHPEADTRDELTRGLAQIMAAWTDKQKSRLSKHFAGLAFDVRPVNGPQGDAIKAAIRKLPGLQKFLEREGGLIRWHAQFE